jgi:hypothetical protein
LRRSDEFKLDDGENHLSPMEHRITRRAGLVINASDRNLLYGKAFGSGSDQYFHADPFSFSFRIAAVHGFPVEGAETTLSVGELAGIADIK